MKIGADSEISTIIDVIPDLVEMEGASFLADGIYLGCPEIRTGQVRFKRLKLSQNTFVGNHAFIPAGQTLPPDILIGVSTVADGSQIQPGTSWFGHPPFELYRSAQSDIDPSLTSRPTPIRYWNRVAWELLRIAVPLGPAFASITWTTGVLELLQRWPLTEAIFLGVPLLSMALASSLVSVALALKWLFLGRVRPGEHGLWSCWCSRWDFHYVLWSEWARPVLAPLEGSLLLNPVLRLLGMKIGRGVVLGTGFSQVVDPDMLHLDDGATVSAMFQAHTFEDRVLKIDHIRVGPNSNLGAASVVLFGAAIGDSAKVAAHGVVMKYELLNPGLVYEGVPTHEVCDRSLGVGE